MHILEQDAGALGMFLVTAHLRHVLLVLTNARLHSFGMHPRIQRETTMQEPGVQDGGSHQGRLAVRIDFRIDSRQIART
jgi:hypothetical protein